MMMMNCFCGMVDRRKAFYPYFQPGPLSEILTITNLWHTASRVWTCAEPEFRLSWMKLCSSNNHCTLVPQQSIRERIRERIQTVLRKLKQWAILKKMFYKDLRKISCITKLDTWLSAPLNQITMICLVIAIYLNHTWKIWQNVMKCM